MFSPLSTTNDQFGISKVDPNPPCYELAKDFQKPNEAAPPPYNSLFNQLRDAKAKSSNATEFIKNGFLIVCGSLIVTILIVVLLAIIMAVPVALIAVGVYYINDCPIQPKIPMWLCVAGGIGCLSSVIRISKNCYTMFHASNSAQHGSTEPSKTSFLTSAVEMFLLVWFICGNIWIYPVKDTVSFDPTLGRQYYCNQTCYMFATYFITITWIVLAILCCCCCFLVLVAGCFKAIL